MEKFSKFESTSPHENIRKKNRKILTYKFLTPRRKYNLKGTSPSRQKDQKNHHRRRDFVTINRLAKELGISHRVVSTAADDVSSFEARGVGGEKLLSTKNRNLRETQGFSLFASRRTRENRPNHQRRRGFCYDQSSGKRARYWL